MAYGPRTEAQGRPAGIRLRMPPNLFGGGRHLFDALSVVIDTKFL